MLASQNEFGCIHSSSAIVWKDRYQLFFRCLIEFNRQRRQQSRRTLCLPHPTNITRYEIILKSPQICLKTGKRTPQLKVERRPHKEESQSHGLEEKWRVTAAVGKAPWSQRRMRDRLTCEGSTQGKLIPMAIGLESERDQIL